MKFATFQEGFCEFILVITSPAPPARWCFTNIYLENRNSTTTQTGKHYPRLRRLYIRPEICKDFHLTIYTERKQWNNSSVNKQANEIALPSCDKNSVLPFRCETLKPGVPTSTILRPITRDDRHNNNSQYAQPIRGQYWRLLTNQRPRLSLMMSSSTKYNTTNFSSQHPLFIQCSLCRLKESQELINTNLPH